MGLAPPKGLKRATATFPVDTQLGDVSLKFCVLSEWAPWSLTHLMLDLCACHPDLPCLHVRMLGGDWQDLCELLDANVTTSMNMMQKGQRYPFHVICRGDGKLMMVSNLGQKC